MDFPNISDHMGHKLQVVLPTLSGSHPSVPEGAESIDLSNAENSLLAEEILPLAKSAIAETLTRKSLFYPAGFGGEPELLTALAEFFNGNFRPAIPVTPDHIITASGAGNALGALTRTICDPGDVVFVIGPCWEGFIPYLIVNADVTPTIVRIPSLERATQIDIVEALEKAYEASEASESKKRARAVILTNPVNPLGKCYSVHVLRKIRQFCSARGMHLISDEVYAMSKLQKSDDCTVEPFVSALAVNGDADAARVHVIWSMSKDFACSGIRMGCIVSQSNLALRFGSGLASYWQTSSLASIVATNLLRSSELCSLMSRNSERLGAGHGYLTNGLSRLGLKYITADYGLFVFAKIGRNCQSDIDEQDMVKDLAQRGLIVAPGRRFSCGENEHGWARLNFSVSQDKLGAALGLLEGYLDEAGAKAQS